MPLRPDDPILKYVPLFDVWQPEELLGSGTNARVYKVEQRDEIGTREKAVKMIVFPKDAEEWESMRGTNHQDEAFVQSAIDGRIETFRREIQSLEKLSGNGHIVQYIMHQVIQEEMDPSVVGMPKMTRWVVLILMELLTPLNVWVKDRQITEPLVAKIGIDILTALEACAREGIYHRDIKMENTFVDDNGVFKLGDFGESRFSLDTSTRTMSRGSPIYMAPESWRGEFSIASDMFSLGIMLYALLNDGLFPYMKPEEGFSNEAINRAHLQRMNAAGPMPGPRNASDKMTEILLKCCDEDPLKRFQSPTEMKSALAGILAQGPRSVPRAVLVALGVLIVLAVAAFALIQINPWGWFDGPDEVPTAASIMTAVPVQDITPSGAPTEEAQPSASAPVITASPAPMVTQPPPTISPDDYRLPETDEGVTRIGDSETKLMLAPSAFSTAVQYENRTAVIVPPGEAVEPLWRDGDWVYVNYTSSEGDMYGYIESDLLTDEVLASLAPMPNANAKAIVIEDTYVRSQPSADSPAQTKVMRTTSVTLLGFSANDWAYVKLVTGGTVVYGYLPQDAYREVTGQ